MFSLFPAHAGVILPWRSFIRYRWTFSRTCGGDPGSLKLYTLKRHFFPHMRGWSIEQILLVRLKILFPAHAGVIHYQVILLNLLDTFSRTCGGDPSDRPSTLASNSFSRTCGGDPKISYREAQQILFFPHMRGWSIEQILLVRLKILFPAHAGVIHYQVILLNLLDTFSRTCGGDPSDRPSTLASNSFSRTCGGDPSGISHSVTS